MSSICKSVYQYINSNIVPAEIALFRHFFKDCKGGFIVIGCDEAGRGPLAGPVVAAACAVWIPPSLSNLNNNDKKSFETYPFLEGLDDSKKLNKKKKEKILREILSKININNNKIHQQQLENYFSASFDDIQFDKDINEKRGITFCEIPFSMDGKKDVITKKNFDIKNESIESMISMCPYWEALLDNTTSSTSNSKCLGISTSIVPVNYIDNYNILNASLKGMGTCAYILLDAILKSSATRKEVSFPPILILIDGTFVPVELSEIKEQNSIVKKTRKRPRKDSISSKVKVDPTLKPEWVVKDILDKCDIIHFKQSPIDTKKFLFCNHSNVKKDQILVSSHLKKVAVVPVIKGDALCSSISAASICAKELRDAIMSNIMDKLFPQYKLFEHKGYPTASHLGLIKEHGIIEGLHRLSYGPIKEILKKNEGEKKS